SEVATLVAGAELLKAEGVKIRVVSVPSEGLFRDQSKEYQQSVLPAGVAKFGLTSGLPVTLAGLVGADGEVFGVDHFGYSAPASVLDKEFGFSGENVYKQVKAMLGK
ncbi:MAG: transketolase, partial [Alistipes sp.]|nr:transketolase [Alistipes sp.]